jgi:hypothetical protein
MKWTHIKIKKKIKNEMLLQGTAHAIGAIREMAKNNGGREGRDENYLLVYELHTNYHKFNLLILITC